MKRRTACGILAAVIVTVILAAAGAQARPTADYALHLVAGNRQPTAGEMERFFAELPLSPYPLRGAVMQFDAPPSASVRTQLRAVGVELYGYIPDMAYLAAVPATLRAGDLSGAGVRWVGTLRTEEKLAEILIGGPTPDWCRDESGLARFEIRLFPHIPAAAAALWLEAEYGAVIRAVGQSESVVAVSLPAENWFDIAADERVLRVEPFLPRRALNNSNRANTRADVAQAAPYNLDGAGVMVGEWDEGQVGSHTDLNANVTGKDNAAVSSHSTHVAGTIVGTGAASSGAYKGMAPGAHLLSYQWWNSSGELEVETQSAITVHDLDLTNNSWGVGFTPPTTGNCNAFLGNYFSECQTLDNVVRGSAGKPVTIVWAAGNERLNSPDYCGSIGFTWGTIGPYATAKNVIAVGAINSNNSAMTGFSSWGPTDDGRLKPEIVAPGCQSNSDHGVTSTLPGGGYAAFCGTSMAAPTVSGCVALWLDRYKSLNPGQAPLASTVRAALVESADDLGSTGPEYDFGYGRLDIVSAVDILDADAYLESTVADQDSVVWTFSHDGSFSQLSFSLAWDDPGATAGANPTLVNDLDIMLYPPVGSSPSVYNPWVLNPSNPSASATTGSDHINNLEQVRATGALPAGVWRVVVTGFNVPSGPQDFSIAHTPGITLGSGPVNYAVQVVADADTTTLPANIPVAFTLTNVGIVSDTYDVTLTSARGWNITPGALSVPLAALADSHVVFTLAIPPAVLPGIDSVTAVAVSQADPGVSASDVLAVTVTSGRNVTLTQDIDTLGVQGKTILVDFVVSNSGLVADSINWTVSDNLGWTFALPSGTVALDSGRDTTVTVAVTIDDPELIGAFDNILVSVVSAVDPAASDFGIGQILVVADPPAAFLSVPADAALLGDALPALSWRLGLYTPYPPGYDVFTHTVETADDALFTTGLVRYGGVSDTMFSFSSPLPDGVHFWRVWTHSLLGDSTGPSSVRSFEIDTQAPDTPTLLTPAADAYEADTTPVFTWSTVTAKSTGAPVTYRWEISGDSSFTTILDSLWIDSTSHTIADANAFAACSTLVYWRVTARDEVGNTAQPGVPSRYRIYMVGDLNFDCILDVLDVVKLIDYVFRSGSLPDPPGRAEINCAPPLDVLDVVKLIDHVFRGGLPPCGPA